MNGEAWNHRLDKLFAVWLSSSLLFVLVKVMVAQSATDVSHIHSLGG